MILSGAGVGGGSLVYANTLYQPPQPFFDDPQWRDITDWRDELEPFYDQARRMLGVVENPLRTPADDVMEKVATDMGVRRHVPPDPGRRLLRRARPGAGGAGPRPVLRRRRPRAQPLHRLRRVHDRLPPQRQEHPGQELPPPRGGRAARRCCRSRRSPGSRPRDGGGYDVRVRFTKAKARRRSATRTLTAEQVVFSRQRARHPAAAAPDARRGPPAARLAAAGLPLAHELRVDPRRDRAGHEGRLQPGRRDHVVVPPRRAHPHRAGPLRQGQQRDVADADRAHRRRRAAAALAHLAQGDVEGARPRPRPVRREALVRAHRHRARHADHRQLDHRVLQAQPGHRPLAPLLAAGPRRAQPDLDPGRQPGGPQDRRR